MTMSCHRRGEGLLAAAIFLVGLGGCRHAEPRPGSACLTTDGTPLRAKLTGKQAADVKIALAHSLEGHGATARAEALYKEAVEQDPARGDAWLRLAVIHDCKGQFAESASLYAKALKANPGSADVYCDKGYSLYLQNHWSEAEMNLRQALALQTDHPRAHNNLGLVLARIGRGEEALVEFHKAGCSDAAARVNLAFARTLEGDWTVARQQYREALHNDPASVAAKNGLRELEQLLAHRDASPSPNRADSATLPVSHSE